jgi:hypothetical protein
MEEIIHYKFVDEKLTKSVTETVVSTIQAIFSEDEGGSEHTFERQKHIEVDSDEFKKEMANNGEVTVYRETFVVSENLTNNTISLKQYLFAKTLVPVKKLKYKRFKITTKTSRILTINKTTGDYSVYRKSKMGKRYSTFIRKNVSNMETSRILNCMISDSRNNLNMDTAIRLFYGKLGYHNLTNDYKAIVKTFFDEEPIYTPPNTSALELFPFLNYLKVNSIDIISYNFIYYFQHIFNRNKAKYRGLGIVDYMSDYYKIKDKELLFSLLFKYKRLIVNQENEFLLKPNGAGYPTSYAHALNGIDYTELRLAYEFNGGKLNQNVFKPTLFTSNNEIAEYDLMEKYSKMYNLNYYDISRFKDSGDGHIFKVLKIFEFFGIKIKINNHENTLLTTWTYKNCEVILKKIANCLFEAVAIGTYKIDDKTLKRFGRYFKKDEKISVNYSLRNINKIPEEDFNFIRHGVFNFDSIKLSFNIVKNKNVISTIYFNPITMSAYERVRITNDNNLKMKYTHSNFTQAFQNNNNNLASSVNFRFVYSKKTFESFCEKMGVNHKMWVDYLN